VGGVATRPQIVHVLAYSGVPMVASLLLWLLTAALAGRVVFVATPHAGIAPFVLLLLRLQIAAHLFLVLWSLLLQVMGLSEAEGLTARRTFGVWALGQALVMLAVMLLWMLAFGLGGSAPQA